MDLKQKSSSAEEPLPLLKVSLILILIAVSVWGYGAYLAQSDSKTLFPFIENVLLRIALNPFSILALLIIYLDLIKGKPSPYVSLLFVALAITSAKYVWQSLSISMLLDEYNLAAVILILVPVFVLCGSYVLIFRKQKQNLSSVFRFFGVIIYFSISLPVVLGFFLFIAELILLLSGLDIQAYLYPNSVTHQFKLLYFSLLIVLVLMCAYCLLRNYTHNGGFVQSAQKSLGKTKKLIQSTDEALQLTGISMLIEIIDNAVKALPYLEEETVYYHRYTHSRIYPYQVTDDYPLDAQRQSEQESLKSLYLSQNADNEANKALYKDSYVHHGQALNLLCEYVMSTTTAEQYLLTYYPSMVAESTSETHRGNIDLVSSFKIKADQPSPNVQQVLDFLVKAPRDLNYDDSTFKAFAIPAHALNHMLDFSDAFLKGADCKHAHFNHALLIQTDLSEALCAQADFSYAACIDSSFENANCEGSKFMHADCTGADFHNANCKNTDFTNVDKMGSNFDNARPS